MTPQDVCTEERQTRTKWIVGRRKEIPLLQARAFHSLYAWIISKGTNKGRGFWIAPSHWLPDARHISADRLQGPPATLTSSAMGESRWDHWMPHHCLMVCSTQCYSFSFSNLQYHRANIVVSLLRLYLGIERETLWNMRLYKLKKRTAWANAKYMIQQNRSKDMKVNHWPYI